jgi:signal transduction histidine kinase
MILLLSPYQNSQECAALIERATRDQVKIVDSVRLALAALRTHEFVAIVADENLLDCSPKGSDAIVERLGSAIPVFLDMACMRAERISKHVGLALRRRELEYKTTRELAIAELQSELKSEVTGLLISSEIAMKSPNLPVHVSETLTIVLDSARRIRAKLEKS